MTLGDRIALLRQGQLVQVGTPDDLYDRPQTPFAATFVGAPPMNLLPATWSEQQGQVLLTCHRSAFAVAPTIAQRLRQIGDRDILLGIRPEHVHLTEENAAQVIAGTVSAIEPLGRETLLHVQAEAFTLLVLSAARTHTLGERVQVIPDVERLHVFKRE
jgi:multiple sugar transport system ATP-binding protein